MAKRVLRTILRGAFLTAALPLAAAAGFGRWASPYTAFAHLCALAPGILGDYLRIAFYRLTLTECSLSSRISFGSFFAHSEAKLGPNVYIGSYRIIGKAVIGKGAQIASGVQILSGNQQHARNDEGEISGAEEGVFRTVTIGEQCWIGAAAIVMADVGPGTTIGAGSIVSRPIAPHSVAVGNPARVIRAKAVHS